MSQVEESMLDAPLRRWRLAFVDRELEALYQDDRFERTASQARVMILATFLFLASLGIGFAIDVGDVLDPTSPITPDAGLARMGKLYLLGFELPIAAAVLVLSRTGHFRRYHQSAMAIVTFVVLFSISFATYFAPAGYPLMFFASMMVAAIVPAYLATQLRVPIATAVGFSTSASFLVAIFLGHSWAILEHGSIAFWVIALNGFGVLLAWQAERFSRNEFLGRRLIARQKVELLDEQAKSDRLLLNVLPPTIAARLKDGEEPIADRFDDVSVLFADIEGFTQLAERVTADELVQRLNTIFSQFDDIAASYGLEKIKTIGDAYMVASGLPEPREDHAEALANMALEMRDAVRALRLDEDVLVMRIGIATGPAIAGVIGHSKFSYDLWGDTVNIASRMESHGVGGSIQVSRETYEKLKQSYELEPRGEVDIKGKGKVPTWLLLEKSS